MSEVSVSMVVPVYAGKDFLRELTDRMSDMKTHWVSSASPIDLIEAIFVIDGTADGSFELLTEIQQDKGWIKIITLSRNFGQHQATIAGTLHTSGDWVVTLDEDMQHDPMLADKLLEKAIASKSDIVYANPEQDVHHNFVRDLGSKGFKRFVSLVTKNQFVPEFNSFRLLRGSVARGAAAVCSHGTYFDIALCWFSNRITSIKLPLTDRRFVETGQSGYSFRRLLSHARVLIMSSDAKIARFGALLGLLAIGISALLGAKVFSDKVLHPEMIPVEGWASLMLTLLLIGGFIAVLLSIVLEYISLIVLHVQGKPAFFVIDRTSDQLLEAYFRASKS